LLVIEKSTGERTGICTQITKVLTVVLNRGEKMGTQALLVELLLSAFFAVACFRARSESLSANGLAPQKMFVLIGRLERLHRTRWQWCSMVLLLILVRVQFGAPLVAELTAVAEFVLFLALPACKSGDAALCNPGGNNFSVAGFLSKARK
jgi:hypothetical protein